MRAVLAGRLFGLATVLFLVSIAIFVAGTLMPGDAAQILVGTEGAPPEEIDALRDELGLNRPLWSQYWDWLTGVVTFELGTSPITHRSVNGEIAARLPVSLELALLASFVSTVIGVPLGILAAVHSNRRADAFTRVSLLVLFSVPVFVAATLLVLFASEFAAPLYTSVYVPISDGIIPNLRSMLLPTVSISIPVAAITMQMTRTSMLDVLGQPYIRTARAKGLHRRAVVYMHALRNALAPIVTLLGIQFGLLLGGLVIVEEIFNLPGLGRGLLLAVSDRDVPLIMATTMIVAGGVIVANLLIDLSYPLLDPRQRDA